MSDATLFEAGVGLLNVVFVPSQGELRGNRRGERGQVTQRLVHSLHSHLLMANVAGGGAQQGPINIKQYRFTVRQRPYARASRGRQRLQRLQPVQDILIDGHAAIFTFLTVGDGPDERNVAASGYREATAGRVQLDSRPFVGTT